MRLQSELRVEIKGTHPGNEAHLNLDACLTSRVHLQVIYNLCMRHNGTWVCNYQPRHFRISELNVSEIIKRYDYDK